MKIEAIILARKNSKGIPNKNIINFCGKPLIEWTIIQLKKTMNEDNIWISSDSIDILKIAKNKKSGTSYSYKEQVYKDLIIKL